MRALWLVASLGATAVGCATPPPDPTSCTGVIEMGCDRDGGLDGGYVDEASGAWASSPWEGPYFPYPANASIRLCHGLGRTPDSIELYAAFAETGSLAQQIGSAAIVVPNCGDAGEVNPRSVLIRNAGGQDFFARVVLR